jgi:ubiquinone/menaquinone biosynthesis C-methylase UbiE
MGRALDCYLGRGPYFALRHRFEPEWEYSQLAYARVVSAHLNSATRWLDAGCGHQSFADELEEEERKMSWESRLAVGCDIGYSALRKHRSLDKNVCCTLGELPFSDSSFNLVTLNNVVEHLEKPEVVFREFARILESDGRIVVHTPNAGSWLIRVIRFGRRLLPETLVLRFIRFLEFREPEDVFPTHYRANTPKKLSEVLGNAGFEEEQVLLIPGGHLFRFAAPLVIPEMLLNRFLNRSGWRELACAVMLVTYRRTRRTSTDDCARGRDQTNPQTAKREQVSDVFQVPRKIVGSEERVPPSAQTNRTGQPS